MKEPTEEFKRLYQMNDFLFEAGIDNLNLFKVRTYIHALHALHGISKDPSIVYVNM